MTTTHFHYSHVSIFFSVVLIVLCIGFICPADCFGQTKEKETSLWLDTYSGPFRTVSSTNAKITYQEDTKTPPQIPGMIYFNPGIYFETDQYFNKKKNFYAMGGGASLRFYLKGDEEVVPILDSAYLLNPKLLTDYFQPFHFKKHEVTNKEYKQFIYYVRDSIAHSLLGNLKPNGRIDWGKAIFWDDQKLQSMMSQKEGKMTIDLQNLSYEFVDNDGNKQQVNIYPDTVCWNTDWPFSFNTPMVKNYFNGPFFDDYPVVGVSYYQAIAFCDWKTKQLNANKKGKQKWKVSLPNVMQWEWIASWKTNEQRYSTDLNAHDWLTDLTINYLTFKYHSLGTLPTKTYASFTVDGFLYTNPADLSQRKRIMKRIENTKGLLDATLIFTNLDENGISGMGNNVSEWMNASYKENWETPFQMRQKRLKHFPHPTSRTDLQMHTEQFYHDQYCDTNGYLVMGGNWVDERFEQVDGKNKAGIYAKTFVNPENQHSTIGFRYVIESVNN